MELKKIGASLFFWRHPNHEFTEDTRHSHETEVRSESFVGPYGSGLLQAPKLGLITSF
jgi:hypothetical protein